MINYFRDKMLERAKYKREVALRNKISHFEQFREVIGGDSYYRLNYVTVTTDEYDMVWGSFTHLDFQIYEYKGHFYTDISNLEKIRSYYVGIYASKEIIPLKVRMRENRLNRLLL